MAKVSIVVPWSPGCGHREQALRWVLPRLVQVSAEVVVGECIGPWCKAEAVAAGLKATSGDIVAIVDADVWIDDDTWLDECVEHLEGWASPHGTVFRLSPTGTSEVLAGRRSWDTQARHRATAGGGVVVLHRALYDAVPLDPRFVGWGQEDEAWATALRTLDGEPWIGNRRLMHLWHPPQPRQNRAIGSAAGLALRTRYDDAAGDPAAMRALIEEVR